MASAMGAALSRQVTVRPCLERLTRPASERTLRCLSMPGSDIEKGLANALTGMPSVSVSRRASKARLVGSARAANVRSRSSSEHLTIRLSVWLGHHGVKPSEEEFSPAARVDRLFSAFYGPPTSRAAFAQGPPCYL